MAATDVKIPKQKQTKLFGATPTDKPSILAEAGSPFGREPTQSTSEQMAGAKGNWLSNLDIGIPYKAWKKATVAPVGSALAAGALAAGGAYYLAPWIAKKVRARLPQDMQENMSDEDIAKMRKRMAILAALGVGGLSLASNFDPKYPGRSLLHWDYVPKQAGLDAGLVKEAMDYFSNPDVMSQDLIPLDHAKEIVANDKFLTSGQKAAIGTIFDNSPDQQGNASMADITSGAVRAGLGFVGGAVAGYALGKIFALPPAVTRVASITGGLANALRTSGLIS